MTSVQLAGPDHRALLDQIDRLREAGVSRFIDLPQIIVVGDQSAGKSSVLEAISKLSFPTKDNLCTCFASELILRRDKVVSIKCWIIPALDRTDAEKGRLSAYQIPIDNENPDLGFVVGQAKIAMGICETKVFSADILRIELSGPHQPHLSLVDLPGLFRASSRDQSVNDAAIVQKMVTDYMRKDRSIILAVVSAKSDFALQEIIELSRKYDPRGDRTLGLITKPDTLDRGSESETLYFNLARNTDVKLRLGWHVLKNRSYTTKDYTSEQRDQDEEDFFNNGVWTGLETRLLGVKSLVPRLSNVLKDQILVQLPSVIKDIRNGLKECDIRLQQLGIPRGSAHDQRRYLLRVSQEFTVLVKASIDGFYSDPFFGSALTGEGYGKRLRAFAQNTLMSFKDKMLLNGQTDKIVENATKEDIVAGMISRSAYIEKVKLLMQRSRGCELPGTFNPLIIGDLFTEQSRPWEMIITKTMNEVIKAVRAMTRLTIRHVAIEETLHGIYDIVSRGIDGLKKDMLVRIREILQPHLAGSHAMTLNHYLTDNVQKIQAERREQDLAAALKDHLRYATDKAPVEVTIVPRQLLKALRTKSEVDMDTYACNLAVDYMQAYYKVAIKTVIDEVGNLVLEQCLLSKLPALFDPQVVHALTPEQVSRLAGESADNAQERANLSDKADVLSNALAELKRLDRHGSAFTDEHGDESDPEMEDSESYDEDDEEEGEEGSGDEEEVSEKAVHHDNEVCHENAEDNDDASIN